MERADAGLKLKVVAVEDDRDFRAILDQWLGSRYELRMLDSGERLLEELRLEAPDLVIMDVNLPGPDGFDLCRSIRARPEFRFLPILFLSAQTKDADFIRHLEAGGTVYLTKPVERRALLSTLGGLAG